MTIYREAGEGGEEKKRILAGLVLYFFGRLHVKAAKLPSASVRQTIVITEHWVCLGHRKRVLKLVLKSRIAFYQVPSPKPTELLKPCLKERCYLPTALWRDASLRLLLSSSCRTPAQSPLQVSS